MWKRYGSGKPQQRAAATYDTSLAERPEPQAAVDRSRCSLPSSSGSQVRVLPGASSCRGLRGSVLADGSRRPEECCVSREAQARTAVATAQLATIHDMKGPSRVLFEDLCVGLG